ncbi:hypothetical protein FB451DRAFT_1498506 [Mycena latifolia]|nr:hypothetical protein FB451DRAFT_1498506 [Mycena latifolia]
MHSMTENIIFHRGLAAAAVRGRRGIFSRPLFPHTRSNALFVVTFFATRICLHLILLFSYGVARPGYDSSPGAYNSTTAATAATSSSASTGGGAAASEGIVGGGGSVVPTALLALVFPLHVMWFVGCVKGFVKRAKARASASSPTSSTTPTSTPAKRARHPLAPDIYPDAHALAAAAFSPGAGSPWALSSPWLSVDALRLRRLSARVSTLSSLSASSLSLSQSLSLSALNRTSLVLAVNRRMGVHVSGYVAPVHPIRPRARAMARRVSESLIERGERVRGCVGVVR